MPRVIERKLNRTAFASAITLGTDYAAVQLYSDHTKPICLYGVSWGVRSTTPADYGLIAFNDLRILRIGRVTDDLTLANILALPFEEIYHSNCQGSVRNANYEDFGDGLELEAGNNYLILNGDASTTAGTAGTVSLFLTVRGELKEALKYQPRETAEEPDPKPNGGQSNVC